jgi:hypothetical protein
MIHKQYEAFGNKYPLLHIDVHGKKNSKGKHEIDLGTKPLEIAWGKKDPCFV